jgi:hypothetical protein
LNFVILPKGVTKEMWLEQIREKRRLKIIEMRKNNEERRQTRKAERFNTELEEEDLELE